MKRGPRSGTRMPSQPALQKARSAWGDAMPPEVEALARACEASTAKAVSASLGYSGAVISHVLGRTYPGDMTLVFAKVRGQLMGEQLDCPILGMIPTTRCLTEQKRPFAATNSIRARLFHACAGCPNNRKNQEKDHV